MRNITLPRQTAQFLQMLREVQISQNRVVQFDGFFVFSTERAGAQPVVCKSAEGCQNAITSMLENLRSLGYITFLDLCGERLQLTDMGWNYGELSLRRVLTRLSSVFIRFFDSPSSVCATQIISEKNRRQNLDPQSIAFSRFAPPPSALPVECY